MTGPLPPVPKVIRYDLFSISGANNFVRDRLYFQYTGALSIADLGTLLTNASASWGTNMSPSLSNVFTQNTIEGTDLTSTSSAQTTGGTPRVGAGAGTPVPGSACMVIKFRTARRYRGGHPRFYLAGQVASNLVGTDTWSGGAAAAILAAWQAFIAGCIATPPAAVGTLSHVNVSYFSGFTVVAPAGRRARNVPTLRAGGPVVDPIISYAVNTSVASQRRRNRQSP